ncbi:phosphoglycolate phosphatase [Alteromonas sp. D210916BOD_24]|uniref:phosphoglycolate phosphatase n=1 Tax=Alteromonas sp. D210916BOD_24 TaxID=3157618 RepID=UPI00399D46E2
MHKINTVLFDLDGTLVDSVPDLALSLNLALNDLGYAQYSESEVRNWVGNGARMLVKRGLSGSTKVVPSLSEAVVEQAFSRFIHHYREQLGKYSHLYPNVKSTLQRLFDHNIQLAVVTNKPTEFVAPILQSFDIAHYFKATLGGDALAQKKPSPLPLIHLCTSLGSTPEHCIMVGDSKNDILAAKAANMKSVGLSYGYNYGEDIAQHHPDWVFDDFSEVASLFNG